jgi:hypothetical protein
MKNLSTSNLLGSITSAVTLLTLMLVFTASNSSAREHKSKKVVLQSRIVAHIEFTGSSAVDMAMQKQDEGKRFLYVQHGRDEGVSIVDITNPSEARVIRTLQWPNPEASNRMNVLGNMAIINETEILPAGATASKGDVMLWDLSNPADPKPLQRFSGVVKVLQDDRDFIYLLNGEGLWVISAPNRPAPQDNSSIYGG